MEKYRYEQKGIRIIRKLILGAFVFATANVAGGLWLSKSNMNRANRAEGQNNLINTTGSSDSMVAGTLYGCLRGADAVECFKYANAASMATSMTNDLGSKDKIEELYDTIEVEEL